MSRAFEVSLVTGSILSWIYFFDLIAASPKYFIFMEWPAAGVMRSTAIAYSLFLWVVATGHWLKGLPGKQGRVLMFVHLVLVAIVNLCFVGGVFGLLSRV